MNYLRINEDDSLKFQCETEENKEENTVTITDFTLCDFKESVKMEKIELIDENNEVWAMRRFPERLQMFFNSSLSAQINWTLSVCQDKV